MKAEDKNDTLCSKTETKDDIQFRRPVMQEQNLLEQSCYIVTCFEDIRIILTSKYMLDGECKIVLFLLIDKMFCINTFIE